MDLFGIMRRSPPVASMDNEDKMFTFERKCIVIPPAKGRRGKKIVCGLVYANWCGHCAALKPKWAQMYKNIHAKVRKNKYYDPLFASFEDTNLDLLREFNEKNADYLDNQSVEHSGYPTLFKIQDGKISYYNGEREPEPMERWFMMGNVRKPNTRSNKKKKRRTIKG